MKYSINILAMILLSTTVLSGQNPHPNEESINVIILIGDGMGLSQFSVPYYYGDNEPVFSQFHHIGLVNTSPATAKITDSAAGSTSMFCGEKTYIGAIGMDTDTTAIPNLVETISPKGYMSGIVATYSVTDATPAGFYAHAEDRSMHHKIAADLVESDIDFFAGGGWKYFTDTTGRDIFKEHNIDVNFSGLKKIRKPDPDKRYGFMLAQDYMAPILNGRMDFLPDATRIALDYLSSQEQGFVLMVEGSHIDGGGHGNNSRYLISEMLDFEKTVRVAYDFALADGNTLVIVTADHETGGFTMGAAGDNYDGADYTTIAPTFATTNHSATLVPLLAFGPGSENFIGIYQNSDIFHKILEVIQPE